MKFFLSLLLTFCCLFAISQSSKIKIVEEGVIINNTTEQSPDPDAVLDVSSSNKGVLFPRLTQPQIDQISAPP
ncbi:MAG: hypothetical protein JXR03_02500 [Cyclobacteriaceae bacterium]